MQTNAIAAARAAVARPTIPDVAVYNGPNLFSLTPMVRIRVDLGLLEALPTDSLPGFAAALTRLLPGLATHGCSYGEAGGFLRRMEEGTWLGHVVEHVALELQTMAGAPVTRGKTRSVPQHPGHYEVLYAYTDKKAALLAGRLAFELVGSLLPDAIGSFRGLDLVAARPAELGRIEVRSAVEAVRQLLRQNLLGPTTAALVREAERRGIPWFRMDDSSLVQLGYGRRQQRIRAGCTSRTSLIAGEIAADKQLTKTLLAEVGLPVPQGVLAHSEAEAIAAAGELGYPVVTKPLDGNHGRGVTVGIRSAEELAWAYGQAAAHAADVLVEEQLIGRDHRFLVVGGELVAVAERVPAFIVGDGRSNIAALIETVNADPRRGEGHEACLTKIHIDDCLMHMLASAGRTLETVPRRGERVVLRPAANLSTGGTAIDRTGEVHPDNAEAARQAAAVVGLDVAGIDFVLPDASRSYRETGGGIVEVNAGPGFRMHLFPSQGRGINVARPVLDTLFPPGVPARIPVFAVTGTNGKSTTVRMVGHILQSTGLTVGLTSTSGIYVGGRRIRKVDASGPRSARTVLSHPLVDVAILETARGGILREGLGFDRCDVGCVLNVAADHLGLGGVATVEDLAEVKSVVVQAVKRDGCSVLNADDPQTAAMAEVAGGRTCFFSMLPRAEWPDFLGRHVDGGGMAVTLEGSEILIHDGDEQRLMSAAEIPATFGGNADFNIANALAAAAMAYAQGIAPAAIGAALATFTTSFEHSPGRLNTIDRDGIRVIVDYAHNPHGLRALGRLIQTMSHGYRRLAAVIGMPGDRRDDDIREMGRIAGGLFHDLIIKEDDDRRGRQPGEVAALLEEGAVAGGCPKLRIRKVLQERQAVEALLELADPGDLLLITADDVDAIWELVKTYRKRDPHLPIGMHESASASMQVN